jgi:hypothetical protein
MREAYAARAIAADRVGNFFDDSLRKGLANSHDLLH